MTTPWTRFWFPEVPTRRGALARVLIAGFAFVDLAFFSDWFTRYPSVDEVFADPVYLMRPIFAADLVGLTGAVHLVAVAALLLAAVGLWTRPALLVGGVGSLWLNALFNSFNKVNHGRITVVIALLALSLAPVGSHYAVDAVRRRRARAPDPPSTSIRTGWALRVVSVSIVLHYVGAAFGKLWLTGPSWITDPVLRVALVGEPGALAAWLQRQPELLTFAQGYTLALEVLAVALLLWRGRVRDVLLVQLLAFHLTATLLLGVEFVGLIVSWCVLYDLEVGWDRATAWWRDRTSRGTSGTPSTASRDADDASRSLSDARGT